MSRRNETILRRYFWTPCLVFDDRKVHVDLECRKRYYDCCVDACFSCGGPICVTLSNKQETWVQFTCRFWRIFAAVLLT
ncbi:hypothetical protein BDN72DRAFT_131782 [Pluteus cervinus]|uniref:Uncharacterized protein n=1 Tax=Pluteus cervinus TaxID=181527 RepID=A0ACD3ALQ6_9AGAR|nr:hypothetical protein BDN72DRAFT_131782 [Pluteus cervinus]